MTRFAEIARFAQSRPVASHRRVGALIAIRALPDLCVSIGSVRLAAARLLNWSPKPRHARGFLYVGGGASSKPEGRPVACRAATKKAPHRRGALGKRGFQYNSSGKQWREATGSPGQREHRGSPVFRDASLCERLDNRPCGILVTLGKCFCPITLLGDFPVSMSQLEHVGGRAHGR
jgi:hypothetical protein